MHIRIDGWTSRGPDQYISIIRGGENIKSVIISTLEDISMFSGDLKNAPSGCNVVKVTVCKRGEILIPLLQTFLSKGYSVKAEFTRVTSSSLREEVEELLGM